MSHRARVVGGAVAIKGVLGALGTYLFGAHEGYPAIVISRRDLRLGLPLLYILYSVSSSCSVTPTIRSLSWYLTTRWLLSPPAAATVAFLVKLFHGIALPP